MNQHMKILIITSIFGGHRGRYTASTRSNCNLEVIFEIFDLRNLGIDIHEAADENSNFGLCLEAIEAVIQPQGGQTAI